MGTTLKEEARQGPVAIERAIPIPIPLTLIYLSNSLGENP
jgi:hypothetical protein